MREPKIGDRVRATMNKETWFNGVYETNIGESHDTFAEYGVRVDELDEVRYFIHAELIDDTEGGRR